MRYGPDHKQATRQRILVASGRGFRRLGYGGIGVDGLAKEAGVTTGAIYGHFGSKAEAFEAAAIAGLVELHDAIQQLLTSEGDRWLDAFVDFYVTTKRTCEIGESCALQSLTPEVARADPSTRTAYEAELRRVLGVAAEGLPGDSSAARRKLAWAILSLLSGGVSLARAAQAPKVGSQIASALKAALASLVGAAADAA